MSGPEARIQRDIQKAMVERGVFCFKVHGNEHMMAGLPDLICCVEGIYLGLEVKTPSTQGDVSPRQFRVHTQIDEAGGLAAVVWSADQACQIVEAMRAIARITGLPSMIDDTARRLGRALGRVKVSPARHSSISRTEAIRD